jgi:hypothetical protein
MLFFVDILLIFCNWFFLNCFLVLVLINFLFLLEILLGMWSFCLFVLVELIFGMGLIRVFFNGLVYWGVGFLLGFVCYRLDFCWLILDIDIIIDL